MHVPMSLLAQIAPSCLHLHGYLSFLDNVQLTSNKNTTRRFTCPGDRVVFTCEVFRSSFLEWQNPLINQSTTFTASSPPREVLHRGPFNATLINVTGINLQANFTSTLQVTVNRTMIMRNETTVTCLSGMLENATDNFIYAGT